MLMQGYNADRLHNANGMMVKANWKIKRKTRESNRHALKQTRKDKNHKSTCIVFNFPQKEHKNTNQSEAIPA